MFSFRKRIKLAKGVHLNLSKGGFSSVSIGTTGLTMNLGKKGVTRTLSLPGTGLRHTKRYAYAQPEPQSEQELVINPETTKAAVSYYTRRFWAALIAATGCVFMAFMNHPTMILLAFPLVIYALVQAVNAQLTQKWADKQMAMAATSTVQL